MEIIKRLVDADSIFDNLNKNKRKCSIKNQLKDIESNLNFNRNQKTVIGFYAGKIYLFKFLKIQVDIKIFLVITFEKIKSYKEIMDYN